MLINTADTAVDVGARICVVVSGWVGTSVAGWVSCNATVTVFSISAVSLTALSTISSAGSPQEVKLNTKAKMTNLLAVRTKCIL